MQGSHFLAPSRYMLLDEELVHIALYEKPALLALMPDVAGKAALDIYCGRGLYSRWLADASARVQAVDPTPAMIEITEARCAGLPVTARKGDFEDDLGWIETGSIDVAVSSLSLDYAQDLARAFSTLRRVCRAGATLVFSVNHPMADWHHVRSNAADLYHQTRLFDMHWCGFNQGKSFIEQFRRPLACIVEPLLANGFRLTRLVEPLPAEAMREAAPEQYRVLSAAPSLLCIAAMAE